MNKQTRKGLLSAAIILVLMLAMTTGVFAADYSDTTGHWGESAISTWSGHGVIQGNDGEFRPDSPITRGEMATILSTLLGLTEKDANTFTDLSDDEWYSDAILRCKAAGIISGYTDGTVGAEKYITRQEASVMVSKGLAIKPAASASPLSFADSGDVEGWAVGYVGVLSDMGIISGYPSGEFDPLGNINRASVVVMLDKAISDYITAPGTYSNATFTGIVIVKADEVTFEGCTFEGSVIIAEELGADNKVSIKDSTIKGSLAGAKVETENVTVLEGASTGTTDGGTTTTEDKTPAETPKPGGGGGGGGYTTSYTLELKLESSEVDEDGKPAVKPIEMKSTSLSGNTNILTQISTMAGAGVKDNPIKEGLKTNFADLYEKFATEVYSVYVAKDAEAWKTLIAAIKEDTSIKDANNFFTVIGNGFNAELSSLSNGTYVITYVDGAGTADEVTYTLTIKKS